MKGREENNQGIAFTRVNIHVYLFEEWNERANEWTQLTYNVFCLDSSKNPKHKQRQGKQIAENPSLCLFDTMRCDDTSASTKVVSRIVFSDDSQFHSYSILLFPQIQNPRHLYITTKHNTDRIRLTSQSYRDESIKLWRWPLLQLNVSLPCSQVSNFEDDWTRKLDRISEGHNMSMQSKKVQRFQLRSMCLLYIEL